MLKLMVIFLIACIICYSWLLIVIKMSVKETKDPVFKEKMDGIRIRWDPRIKFFENLFAWVLVLVFIYFIYLG